MASTVAAFGVMLTGMFVVLAPMLGDFSTYGFHDWDVETAYRYITVLSLREYGQLPWWHPWLCGGFPAFGHFEGATNLVSPYLPIYLLSDIRTAIRLEVVGGALTGLVGVYLFTGRFTRSVALRSLVAVLFVLNGRWALQAAVGHTWHLQYGFMPWVFWFFDRARDPGRLHNAVYAGGVLALMAYLGAIYPLPHTALALGVYAVLLALFSWSARPLVAVCIAGVSSLGLAAPKLLAIADTMTRAPRLIESTEVIGLRELIVMMTDQAQRYGSRPIATPAYGWHEWGIYVGVAGVVVLVLAVLFARGARENALKVTGVVFFLLGMGAFHEYAPWALLHQLPLFASQHVPSRFHFPMLLLLGVAFAAWVGRWLDARVRRRPWIDFALLLPVALYTAELAQVSQRPFAQAFWMEEPDQIERQKVFEHRTDAPVNYKRRDWAAPILLSMKANTGVIRCYGLDPNFDGIGAVAANARGYEGRAHLEQGTGDAKVIEWSPNRVVVEVQNASDDALLVYNMNYDPSWSANGEPALSYHNALAARVPAGSSEVTFSYFPRTLKYSLPIALMTLLLSAGVPILWRRRRVRARGRVSSPPSGRSSAPPGSAPPPSSAPPTSNAPPVSAPPTSNAPPVSAPPTSNAPPGSAPPPSSVPPSSAPPPTPG